MREQLSSIGPALRWTARFFSHREQAFYESDPAGYERVVRCFFMRQEVGSAVREVITQRFRPGRPHLIRDVACGTGIITDQLVGCGDDVVGSDLSRAALDFAKQTKNPSIRWRQENFHHLSDADGSVDVLTMIGAHRYVIREQFYAELSRVLSADGIAVIPMMYPDFSLRDWLGVPCVCRNAHLHASFERTRIRGLYNRLCALWMMVLQRRKEKLIGEGDGRSLSF